MLLNCGVGEDSWESLGLQGDPTSPSQRKSVLGVHWKDWCWGWNSNTLATLCKELTHLKKPWFWERLTAGGEGDDRGWDGWMASPIQWTWVWVNLGVDDGQGGLGCCGSWGRKESDFTGRLNWTQGQNNQEALKMKMISIQQTLSVKLHSTSSQILLLPMLFPSKPSSQSRQTFGCKY